MNEPKICPSCGAEFVPGPKKHKQQTCGKRKCIANNTYRKKREAKQQAEEGGGAYNEDGTIKKEYLVRGTISSSGTGTAFGT